MRHWIFVMILMASLSVEAMGPVPELIDIKLVRGQQDVHFEPKTIVLKQNRLYLFVLENDFSETYHFTAVNFAHAINTQFIQGSPSVTKDSIHLPPHSKVQWLLIAKEAGAHNFYAQSYNYQRSQSEAGTITIEGENLQQENTIQASSQQTVLSKEIPLMQGYSFEPSKKEQSSSQKRPSLKGRSN